APANSSKDTWSRLLRGAIASGVDDPMLAILVSKAIEANKCQPDSDFLNRAIDPRYRITAELVVRWLERSGEDMTETLALLRTWPAPAAGLPAIAYICLLELPYPRAALTASDVHTLLAKIDAAVTGLTALDAQTGSLCLMYARTFIQRFGD